MNKRRFLAVVATVAVLLLFASSCSGGWPAIISLEAEAQWAAPLDSLQVTCNASSPNGDDLDYQWSSTGGNVTGTGPEVVWIAPEEVGMYEITVVVEDGQGRKDRESITLIASNGPPPIIEDLIVTADHPYLKKTATAYKALKNEAYYIECVASNTSGELTYEWSSDGGEISGEGSTITWTAPYTSIEVDVTVTVKVIDGIGNWVSASLLFQVVYCESCVDW